MENNKLITQYDSEGNFISKNALLTDEGNDITNKIVFENDPDKLDNLTKLFSLNQKKKQIVRINKLSSLLDKVDNEVVRRFEEFPETIEDRDLYKYWQATSDIINGRSEDDNSIPRVQINNQTNINLNSQGLNRESRARVLDAVSKILSEANNDVIDVNVEEVDREV